MKPFPLNCSDHLSELTTEIKTATPDRASEIVYRVSYLLVFAGYGDAAYETLSSLRSGALRLNPYLEGAIRSYNNLVLNLCNALAIDSPELSTQPSMPVVELSKFIQQQDCDRRSNFLFEKNFGIQLSSEMEACIRAESEAQAIDCIVKWWRTEDRSFYSMDKLIACILVVRSLLSGALQNDIQVSPEQVNRFIFNIRNYQYVPQPLFTPSPSDWSDLLKKWNNKMFLDSSELDLETYVEWYPDESLKKDCTKSPASETDIHSLEQRLGKRLPPSYRNFFLASNGWTFMKTFTEVLEFSGEDTSGVVGCTLFDPELKAPIEYTTAGDSEYLDEIYEEAVEHAHEADLDDFPQLVNGSNIVSSYDDLFQSLGIKTVRVYLNKSRDKALIEDK
jgi:hypothetical protein